MFFDFLPLNAVVIKGFVTKFQLYTVPGQVIYNATRQLVLRSVDGVVFVADSQWEKMEENVESFKNLEDNLAKQNISIDEIPYVLQYNKRDLREHRAGQLSRIRPEQSKAARAELRSHLEHRARTSSPRSTRSRRFLLHKFSKQSDAPKTAAAPGRHPG